VRRFVSKLSTMFVGVALIAAAQTASATLLVDASQVGSDVVFTASGTLDLTGLTLNNNTSCLGLARPALEILCVGPKPSQPVDVYRSLTSPGAFGTSTLNLADFGSGDMVGVSGTLLIVPLDYVSGTALSSSSTYSNSTIASLGLTAGSYSWVLPSADTFTLTIGNAVPEPATLMLMSLGLGGLGFARRRKDGA